MELQLKNKSGQVVGEVEVSDALFGVPFNSPLVHQAMVMYQANRRQGSHSTKTRSEVSGGGAKPWRQKHTGRARQGSIRSPQWRHGGVVFGPKPRSYRRDMPKRMRRLALKCVLSQKVRDDRLVLVDTLSTIEGRTKSMAQALKDLEIAGSTLIVTEESRRNVVQATHNLGKVWTLPVALLNAGELLKYNTVLMTLEALRKAEVMWAAAEVGVAEPEEATVVPEATTAVAEEVEPEEATAEPEAIAAVAGEVELEETDAVPEATAAVAGEVEPEETTAAPEAIAAVAEEVEPEEATAAPEAIAAVAEEVEAEETDAVPEATAAVAGEVEPEETTAAPEAIAAVAEEVEPEEATAAPEAIAAVAEEVEAEETEAAPEATAAVAEEVEPEEATAAPEAIAAVAEEVESGEALEETTEVVDDSEDSLTEDPEDPTQPPNDQKPQEEA